MQSVCMGRHALSGSYISILLGAVDFSSGESFKIGVLPGNTKQAYNTIASIKHRPFL